MSFSISFLIRSQGADFGFELNEFDPFFNFRATEFIVENGYSEYFEWHDDLARPKAKIIPAPIILEAATFLFSAFIPLKNKYTASNP